MSQKKQLRAFHMKKDTSRILEMFNKIMCRCYRHLAMHLRGFFIIIILSITIINMIFLLKKNPIDGCYLYFKLQCMYFSCFELHLLNVSLILIF